MKKALYLGTSNGLISGGIVQGLSANFEVDCRSIGASPSLLAHYLLDEIESIEAYDTVFIDYCINDNEHVKKGWIDKEHLYKSLRDLYGYLHSFNFNVVVIVLPTLNYLNDFSSNLGVAYHTHLAQLHEFTIYNGYEFVLGVIESGVLPEDIFLDNAHLMPSAAMFFGLLVSKLSLKINKIITKSSTSTTSYHSKKARCDRFISRCYDTKVYHGSYLTLSGNDVLRTDLSEEYLIHGVLVDANSSSIVQFKFDDSEIVKNLYSGTLSESKVQVRFVPFFKPVFSSSISVSLSGKPETESSPTNNKGCKNGFFSIFGFLVSRMQPPSNPEFCSCSTNGSLSFDDSYIVRMGGELYALQFKESSKMHRQVYDVVGKYSNADLNRDLAILYHSFRKYSYAADYINRAKRIRPDGPWINKLHLDYFSLLRNRKKVMSDDKVYK
jgi:hypothetical protein